MEANFDNMRRQATASMNELQRVLKEKILTMDNYHVDSELKAEIISAFNQAAYQVDSLNLLYDDAVEDDMNDLSNVIEIELLEIEDEEEDENEL